MPTHEPDALDISFARDKRQRRWVALHEDGAMFGLVPAEAAELAILDQEFGPYDERAKDADA